MEKEIIIDGLKIAYEESGPDEGKPVVLLHGWGCTHHTVKFIASCLNDKMKVFSIDLPGHGASDEPSEVWDSFDFANLLNKFINSFHLEKPSLIGHSFGGRTIIAFASSHKSHKIVLVDAAGIKPRRPLKYYYKVYSYKLIKKLSKFFMSEENYKKSMERILQKRGSADYKSSTPKMRQIMSRCVNQDLKKELRLIESPTLLVWGEEDTATPLNDAKTMEKLIPDAGLVSFPGCGHYSFLDNPGGFRGVIREFFKDELNSKK